MTISRSAVLVALAASALTLTACNPPHEQDSEEKVPTATGFSAVPQHAAPSTSAVSTSSAPSELNANATQFIDCTRTPTVEPSQVQLDCFGAHQVTALKWEWDAASAIGQGVQINPNGSTERVTLELSEPVTMDGSPVFSQVSLNGLPLGAS